MPSLEDLPVEILFEVLSFCSPFDPTLVPFHPLYALAATNRHLESIVEEYARGLIKQHVKTPAPKKPRKIPQRRLWFRWLDETCQMCGKKSRRQAILDPTMTCCQACDKKHFPKRTMTDAHNTYTLSKLDIFTPNALHPDLPPLTMGTYVCMGTDATMISESDLIARRAYVHGLLGDKANDASYLRRRQSAHSRIIKHLQLIASPVTFRWVPNPLPVALTGPNSMKTGTSRMAYVRENLVKEWKQMGMEERFAQVPESMMESTRYGD